MKDLIPMYLYTNTKTFGNYLSDENIETDDVELITKFYVINPKIRPIPPGTTLLCAKNTEVVFSTESIDNLYDPHNDSIDCNKFIAWLTPVPFTTPVYVYEKGMDILVTLDDSPPGNEYVESNISPIYVIRYDHENILDDIGFEMKGSYCYPIYYKDDKRVSLTDCLENSPTYEPSLIERIRSEQIDDDVRGNMEWSEIIMELTTSFIIIAFIVAGVYGIP